MHLTKQNSEADADLARAVDDRQQCIARIAPHLPTDVLLDVKRLFNATHDETKTILQDLLRHLQPLKEGKKKQIKAARKSIQALQSRKDEYLAVEQEKERLQERKQSLQLELAELNRVHAGHNKRRGRRERRVGQPLQIVRNVLNLSNVVQREERPGLSERVEQFAQASREPSPSVEGVESSPSVELPPEPDTALSPSQEGLAPSQVSYSPRQELSPRVDPSPRSVRKRAPSVDISPPNKLRHIASPPVDTDKRHHAMTQAKWLIETLLNTRLSIH
jgi:hypothetical protein